MKKTIVLFITLFLLPVFASAEGWQLRQVKINHLQSGSGEAFMFSFSSDTKVISNCDVGAWGENWGGVSLDNVTEQKKYMLTLAMSAHASGKLVDIGGTKGSCLTGFGNLPIITYIRVGDYTKK